MDVALHFRLSTALTVQRAPCCNLSHRFRFGAGNLYANVFLHPGLRGTFARHEVLGCQMTAAMDRIAGCVRGMGIQVALNHRTLYRYEHATALGPQVIRLHPAPHSRVPILHYSLDVTPADHLLNWQTDLHSNRFARLLFPQKTNEFYVEVNLVADLSPVNPFDFFLEPGVEQYPFSYPPALTKDLEPFRSVDLPGPLLRAFLAGLDGETCGTITFLLNLNRKVRDEIAYVTRLAPGLQSSEETLEKRSGSCRDSAWLLVECLRNLGIAARFVSGYLIQLAADGSSPAADGPKADSADLHAWAEAYLPGAGWIGLDPTSGLVAGEGHIPLACTPDCSRRPRPSKARRRCPAQTSATPCRFVV